MKNGQATPEPPKRPIRDDHIRVTNWKGALRVQDAKGRDVPGIIAADIAMRPGIPPLMRINLAAGMLDVDGVPTYAMMDPIAGKFRPIKRVEFMDGPDFVPVPPQPASTASAPALDATKAPAPGTEPSGLAKPAEG